MAGEGVDREELCRRFDAAIDELEGALRECPDELWEASVWVVRKTDPWVWPAPGVEPIPERTEESIQQFSSVWAVATHCLWFLDFYVSANPSDFRSPDYMQGNTEEAPWPANGAAPLAEVVFDRETLLRYSDHGRRQIRQRIEAMPDAEFEERCGADHPHAGKTLRQLLDGNLRHVIEHGGQLKGFVEAHRRPAS